MRDGSTQHNVWIGSDCATKGDAEKFEELLRSDKDLQDKLTAAMEAFDGNKADENEVFDAVIAPLAASMDLPITLEEVKGLAMDDEEFDAVAGGGICFIIGGSDDASAECAVGGCVCVWIGVTFDAD